MKKLLFVTNLQHGDRDEDLFLASVLAKEWDLTITDANGAARIVDAGGFDVAFIRNAWPSFEFDEAFAVLEQRMRDGLLRTYNPPSASRGFHENKTYLLRLYEVGYPVIPSFETVSALLQAHPSIEDRAVYKPLNSCSGIGFMAGPADELPTRDGLYQPLVEFDHEVSLFFIDNEFVYALRSTSRSKRWELSEFEPSVEDIAWARRFVDWNRLPYGIQRIDGCRVQNGGLWLTEVEDFLPYLSLSVLAPARRDEVVSRLLGSVRDQLIKH